MGGSLNSTYLLSVKSGKEKSPRNVLHMSGSLDNGLAADWVPNNHGFTEDLIHSISYNLL